MIGNEPMVVKKPKETGKSVTEVPAEPFRSQESHIIKIVGIRQKWESGNLREDD